jgi:hypothetical protein
MQHYDAAKGFAKASRSGLFQRLGRAYAALYNENTPCQLVIE